MAAKFTRFSEKRETTGSDFTSYDDPVSGIEPEESAGLHIPLPENNMGFLLMQKMGWSNGVGLGKNEQGRTDPVPLELKGDYMGLGRFQMELDLASEATEKRKQLEIEKQLTPNLIDKYKAQVEREQAIAEATSDLRKSYRCDLCDKQYVKYSEYDNHLNSYDHHHRQRLKELHQLDKGRKLSSHKKSEEIQEKKASIRMVVKERAQMKAERYHQRKEGGDGPGFRPIGAQRNKGSVQPINSSQESHVAIASALRKRAAEEIVESEKKIADKKAQLAKYGVKFQSAGVLATISDKDRPSMSSYQSTILNTTPVDKTDSNESSKAIYEGRFVMASSDKKIQEDEENEELRQKRLSDLPQASGRKAEHLAAVKAAFEDSGDEDEDFTTKKTLSHLNVKKPTTTKQMSLKLTGNKYESYYY